MNKQLNKQLMTDILNDHLAGIMKLLMSDVNSGDQTPEQAVEWDYLVYRMAGLITNIYNQNT